ncbi:MAG: hypothetical protein C0467_22285 [Planctomycetaceae bacterium]|nr:hypothetical protein [Planctomycetaceae bacterium]
MIRGLLVSVAGVCVAWQVAPAVQQPVPPAPAPVRKLLYPANPSDVPAALKPHIERLLAADQKPVNPENTTANGVFLRVLSRHHAMDGAKLKSGGWIGPRPAVFLTVPEAAYGRDLLGIFSAIGYDPEDILDTERGVEKVAVLFAYPEKVQTSDVKDGALPAEWDCRVFLATWDNLFSLVDRMAADKERWVTLRPEGDGFVPTKLQLRSERELSFLKGFPDEGKRRVKATEYAALRETGGSDWVYRQLVERLFGASEHYRGDGKTKLTLAGKRKPRVGFPEFLGPNSEFKDLPALAIVGLGAIRVSD